MSLAIVVADSAQALAVSDGRMFSCIGGKKKLFRDDCPKVSQVAPRICIAATNQGALLLLEAVMGFVSSYQGTERLFGDVVQFAWNWLDRDSLRMDVAVVIFGWDDRLGRMRVVYGARSGAWQFSEQFATEDHQPRYVAIGRSESLTGLPPESFSVADPMRVLRETLAAVVSRDSDVGGRVFESLVQAPEDVLRATDRGRVWPAFDPREFADKLKANPPVDSDAMRAHAQARLLLHAAAKGISPEVLAAESLAQFPRA
jgi:hypothetical protein